MTEWTSLLNGLNATMLGVFGREVVYLPQAGGPGILRGILEHTREAQEHSPGVYAVLFVRIADLPGPPVRGDAVEIDGARYKVFDIEADTSGAAVLKLRQI